MGRELCKAHSFKGPFTVTESEREGDITSKIGTNIFELIYLIQSANQTC